MAMRALHARERGPMMYLAPLSLSLLVCCVIPGKALSSDDGGAAPVDVGLTPKYGSRSSVRIHSVGPLPFWGSISDVSFPVCGPLLMRGSGHNPALLFR